MDAARMDRATIYLATFDTKTTDPVTIEAVALHPATK